MTDTTTQTIAAMLDGVTPGPWAVEDEWDVAGPDYGVFRGAPDIKHDAESAANARFTAWARDAVPALAAERDTAIARAEAAEKERESLIEAGIACCNGTPNPTIPRIDLALSFIKSTRQALKAANQVWQDYKARAEAAEARLAELEAAKDGAYLERNKLVLLLASMFPSGIKRTAIPGWSDDWHGCVYIDFPWGQASWHYHDSQAYLFAHLSPYLGEWDGHSTETKYAAILAAAKGGRG
jgi:hypothetical protein